MLVVRRPGAAVATAFLAAAVSWLLGAWWGLSVLWYGVLQGLAPELVFAAGALPVVRAASRSVAGRCGRGRRPGHPGPDLLVPGVDARLEGGLPGGLHASSALIAGLGSLGAGARLARTGVLDAFPLGRERVGV